MSLGSIFAALIRLFSSFVDLFRQNQLIKAGADGVIATTTTAEIKEIQDAVEVREKVRVSNSSVPVTDSLPDDGFRRD